MFSPLLLLWFFFFSMQVITLLAGAKLLSTMFMIAAITVAIVNLLRTSKNLFGP